MLERALVCLTLSADTSYDGKLPSAGVAQWQSEGLIIPRPWVRFPPPAPSMPLLESSRHGRIEQTPARTTLRTILSHSGWSYIVRGFVEIADAVGATTKKLAKSTPSKESAFFVQWITSEFRRSGQN